MESVNRNPRGYLTLTVTHDEMDSDSDLIVDTTRLVAVEPPAETHRRDEVPSSLGVSRGTGLNLLRPDDLAEALSKHFRTKPSEPSLAQDRTQSPAEDATQASAEDDVYAQLEQATDVITRQLHGLLRQGHASLGEEVRQELLAHIVRLYTLRKIGKGFSVLIHTLWNILESPDVIGVDTLRLFRDTLERLYAEPRMTYEQARALRKDLQCAGLSVENRELRKLLIDAIFASRSFCQE